MISGQAIFQIIACLVLHYCLQSIYGQTCVSETECNAQHAERSTVVFNTFVFCQIFNQLSECSLVLVLLLELSLISSFFSSQTVDDLIEDSTSSLISSETTGSSVS